MNYLEFLIKSYKMLTPEQLYDKYIYSDGFSNTVGSDMKTAIRMSIKVKSPIEKKRWNNLIKKYNTGNLPTRS